VQAANKDVILVIQSKNNEIPKNTMIYPPTFTSLALCFLIQFNLPTKKDSVKNGIANPRLLLIINTIPLSGWVAAKERTTAQIGPIHGVHPMEKAIPIKNDPINPVGLFLKVSCLFFIKNVKFKTVTITKQKKIIKNEPMSRIIS